MESKVASVVPLPAVSSLQDALCPRMLRVAGFVVSKGALQDDPGRGLVPQCHDQAFSNVHGAEQHDAAGFCRRDIPLAAVVGCGSGGSNTGSATTQKPLLNLWIAKIKDEQLGLRAEYSQKIGNWPEGVASHCFRRRATRI